MVLVSFLLIEICSYWKVWTGDVSLYLFPIAKSLDMLSIVPLDVAHVRGMRAASGFLFLY